MDNFGKDSGDEPVSVIASPPSILNEGSALLNRPYSEEASGSTVISNGPLHRSRFLYCGSFNGPIESRRIFEAEWKYKFWAFYRYLKLECSSRWTRV